MRGRVLGAKAAVVAGGLLIAKAHAGPQPAEASNFGWNGTIFLSDDSNLIIYYSSLTSRVATSVDGVRGESLDPTNLITTRVTTHGSGIRQADISVVDEYYGDTGWSGQSVCQQSYYAYFNDPDMVYFCVHNHVRINLSSYRNNTDRSRKHVVCQELGHAVGLRHTTLDGSCMESGDFSETTLSKHDAGHINTQYKAGNYFWDGQPV